MSANPAVTGEVLDSALLQANDDQNTYGDFASMHEGYGVLAEEVAELFEAVRMGQKALNRGARIRAEAVQVAAVALRIASQAMRVTR